jgi:DNA polymerase-3 subunit alpha
MIAIQLAGYSWLEADKFRKAIGKKIPEEMAAQKEKFQKGCLELGMKPDVVKALWEQIETFAAYGFNKAHAASYGNLAYKTAYLKANYPVDYMAALLTADAGDVERVGEIVGECKRMGITVLAPSVNESRGTFTVIDETTIRFGLYSIKNFGTGVSDSIVAARESGGTFADVGDFLLRVADKNLNKKSLESLIQCGALDGFGERGILLGNIDTLLAYHKESAGQNEAQGSLFGAVSVRAVPPRLAPAPSIPASQRLAWEKDLLGVYVSGHPLDEHQAKFAKVKDIAATKAHMLGVTTVIGGLVETANTIVTKGGEKMCFLRLADYKDAIEVVIFPKTYADTKKLLESGSCILVKGKVSERNGEKSFIAEAIRTL